MMTLNKVRLRLTGGNFTDRETFAERTHCNRPDNPKYKYGLPLMSTENEIYVADNEGHNAILGETGGGKSESVSTPQTSLIALSGSNGLIIDPKGDLYRKTYGIFKREGYDIHVLNFRDIAHSSGYNPLSVIYETYCKGDTGSRDKAIEMVHNMSQTLMNMQSNPKDPFWDISSSQSMAGFILSLMECAESPDEVNLRSILRMMDYFTDKGRSSMDVKRFIDFIKERSIPAYSKLNSLLSGPSETAASIRSVTASKMEIFYSSEQLIRMLSYSSFNPADFLKDKTVLFLILPDENKKYHQIAALIVKQIYSWLVSHASASPEGRLKNRLCILIEEMGNINLGPETVQMITAARSRNINFTLVIQSMSQLLEMYGKHTAATILYNCRNWICLPHREPELQDFIIKSAGTREYMVRGRHYSMPLITNAGINSLAIGEGIALVRGSILKKTSFVRFIDLNFGYYEPLVNYPELKTDIAAAFDIKDFMEYLRETGSKNCMVALAATDDDDDDDDDDELPF